MLIVEVALIGRYGDVMDGGEGEGDKGGGGGWRGWGGG